MKLQLKDSQNKLLDVTLERHTREIMELASMYARELNVTNSPTTLQELVKNRAFDVPETQPQEARDEAVGS